MVFLYFSEIIKKYLLSKRGISSSHNLFLNPEKSQRGKESNYYFLSERKRNDIQGFNFLWEKEFCLGEYCWDIVNPVFLSIDIFWPCLRFDSRCFFVKNLDEMKNLHFMSWGIFILLMIIYTRNDEVIFSIKGSNSPKLFVNTEWINSFSFWLSFFKISFSIYSIFQQFHNFEILLQ